MTRPFTDRILRLLARAACKTFYRDISLVGAERIPAGRPIIFVGNHGNGLIDPALVMGFLPPTIRFLAKARLWKNLVVAPFVRWAGAIPIERRQDPGADMSRNMDAFRHAREHLQAGGMLCIFPEGMSHDQPALARMKTGTARIALEAAAESPDLGLAIVPFGLAFSARDRFRSRVGMVIGDPIEVANAGPEPSWEEVETLTGEIERGLSAVTLNYESWREHRLVRRAVDLFLSQPGDAGARALTDRLPTHRLFLAAYQQLQREHPGPTRRAAAAVLAYDRLLDLVGLTDRQVLDPVPLGRLASLTLRSLAYVLFALPLAAVGFVLHAVPYLVARGTLWFTRQPLHQRATWAVLAGVLIVPTIWLGITAWAIRRWGWIGCLGLLLGPVSGWVALRVAETLYRLWHTARGLAALHLGSATHELLLTRRTQAQQALAEVVEIYTGDAHAASRPVME